ncbi:MAG: hypothetical protein ACRD27_08785, partial [Terracidiphilus sp.]
VLDLTAETIDGFESPFGMELLATVDWLIVREHCEASVAGIRTGMSQWPAGPDAARRKLKQFDERVIGLALERIAAANSQILS